MSARRLWVIAIAVAAAIPTGAAGAATVAGAGTGVNSCTVTLTMTATQATAIVNAGCTGGGYQLVTYAAQSNLRTNSFPQQLYSITGQAPYTVALPPCFWQVDFVRDQAPRHVLSGQAIKASSVSAAPGSTTIGPVTSTKTTGFIAGELGGHPCTPTPTPTPAPVPPGPSPAQVTPPVAGGHISTPTIPRAAIASPAIPTPADQTPTIGALTVSPPGAISTAGPRSTTGPTPRARSSWDVPLAVASGQDAAATKPASAHGPQDRGLEIGLGFLVVALAALVGLRSRRLQRFLTKS